MPRYVDYATCGCFAKARQLRFSYTASEGIAVLFTQLKKICLQEQMDWAKYTKNGTEQEKRRWDPMYEP